jgi:pimeloyl-ACP methyl ester carboxylesterase
VALALALDHPQCVAGLVLASGYYFPTARADAALFSPPSIPLLGDAISYTVAPLIGEIMGPSMIKKMFAPQPVSPRFEREFPLALALRPSQIKAFSEDTSHMITAAGQLSPARLSRRGGFTRMADPARARVATPRMLLWRFAERDRGRYAARVFFSGMPGPRLRQRLRRLLSE